MGSQVHRCSPVLWLQDDVRNFVATLVLQALKNAAQFDDALPTAENWQVCCQHLLVII